MPYVIYLLHFSAPVSAKRHYIGITAARNAARRIEAHRTGNGAKLTRRAVASGVQLTLARTWRCDHPRLERVLKMRGHAKKMCPVCNPSARLRTQSPRLLERHVTYVSESHPTLSWPTPTPAQPDRASPGQRERET